jgi:hypothetical protein
MDADSDADAVPAVSVLDERVDPKPLGIEELPAPAAVLEAGLVARISRVRLDRH